MWIDTLESRRMLSSSGTVVFGSEITGGEAYRLVTTNSGGTTIATLLPTGHDLHIAQRVNELKVSKTGTLFVTGTSGDDTLNITVKNGKLLTTGLYKTVPADDGGSYVLIQTPMLTRTIKRVVVVGLGGDDNISVNSDTPVTVRGSAGNDTLTVLAPKREVVGGSGEDEVSEFELYTGNGIAKDSLVLNVVKR